MTYWTLGTAGGISYWKAVPRNKSTTPKNVLIKEQIAKVIEWCAARSLVVAFTTAEENGQLDNESKEIIINSRYASPMRLHVLLHECGHWILANKEKSHFAKGTNGDEKLKRTRSQLSRVAQVEEEYKAWAEGYALALELGIDLDVDAYNKTETEMIRSYMFWATK